MAAFSAATTVANVAMTAANVTTTAAKVKGAVAQCNSLFYYLRIIGSVWILSIEPRFTTAIFSPSTSV